MIGELVTCSSPRPSRPAARREAPPESRSGTHGLTGPVCGSRGSPWPPATVLTPSSTLVLRIPYPARCYDELSTSTSHRHAVLIIRRGAVVGPPAGAGPEGFDFRIVEKDPARVRDPDRYVIGDAADLEVLEQAGFDVAPSVMITTHDDDMNVFLTIYCRRLRPDVQIIARAHLDRNVSTLHRAGADAVLSYATTGANAIWNELTADNTLQLAEGLDVFRVPVPRALVGRTLARSEIRESTGCTVVAVVVGERVGRTPIRRAVGRRGDLVLIGDGESEDRFLRRYRSGRP